jgi:predicted nucleic acid-binding protein
MEVVPTPVDEAEEENNIRDAADRPILRAAIYAKVDVLLTGDKDFLESDVTNPKIMTAAEFID